MKGDPFYESQENHNLIGVANIFLEALFYDVKLDYHVPIISQQGEVSRKSYILERMDLGKFEPMPPQYWLYIVNGNSLETFEAQNLIFGSR